MPGTSRLILLDLRLVTPSAIWTVFVPDCLVTLHADAGLAVDADELSGSPRSRR